MDLLVVMEIHGFEIQGNEKLNAYVKKLKIARSDDSKTWHVLKNNNGSDKVVTHLRLPL